MTMRTNCVYPGYCGNVFLLRCPKCGREYVVPGDSNKDVCEPWPGGCNQAGLDVIPWSEDKAK